MSASRSTRPAPPRDRHAEPVTPEAESAAHAALEAPATPAVTEPARGVRKSRHTTPQSPAVKPTAAHRAEAPRAKATRSGEPAAPAKDAVERNAAAKATAPATAPAAPTALVDEPDRTAKKPAAPHASTEPAEEGARATDGAANEPDIAVEPEPVLVSVPPGPMAEHEPHDDEEAAPGGASSPDDEPATNEADAERLAPKPQPLREPRPLGRTARARRSPIPVAPRPTRRWRSARWLGLAAAVIVLLAAGAVTLLPVWLLEQNEAGSAQCFDDVVRTADGDPFRCVEAGWRAELPRRLPWLAVEADKLRASVELRATRLAYDRASAIVPDRQRRDAIAQQLLELTHGLVPPAGSEAVETMLPGAFATVARFAAERDEKAVRWWAFESARATAALPLLRQLAPRGDSGEKWSLNLERGALGCLLGDHTAGTAALEAADVAFRASSEHGDGLDAARLAMIACRPRAGADAPAATEPGALALDPRQVRPETTALLTALEASLELEGAADEALRLLTAAGEIDKPGTRLRLLPWAIRALDRPALGDVLALAQPVEAPAAGAAPRAPTTPWELLDRRTSTTALGFDPVASQSLATELEAMLANLPAKRDKPVGCSPRGCGSDAARAAPHEVLRQLSRDLWFECAIEWARRGNRDQTLSAVARYRAIEPDGPAPELAALLLAVRDAEGALAVLEPAGSEAAGPGAVTRRLRTFEADVDRTLALAHLGRFHEAFAAAERLWSKAASSGGGANRAPGASPSAVAAATAAPTPAERDAAGAGGPDAVVGSRQLAAAWLLAAMSSHAGRERDVLAMLPEPPKVTPGQRPEPSSPLAEVALWLSLASPDAAAEATRRPQRWRLELRATRDAMVTGVLPAVMDLASRAVPDGTDVEVWLDRIFDQDHRGHPVLAARARAEAARWRGDGLGAVDWETRAAVLLRLGEGMPGALLGHYAALR